MEQGWSGHDRREARPLHYSGDTSARLFREAADSSPSGLLIVDDAGIITYANREAARIFGYGPDGLTGLDLETLVPEALRGAHRMQRLGFHSAQGARTMGTGREFTGRRRDGAEVPLEIGLSSLDSDEGSFVVAAVMDVGERVRVREDLRRKNEDLERFAYVASHDLQEPLRTVSNFLHLLEDRYGDRLDDDGRAFVSLALQGAQRMRHLIAALLAVSRVDSHGAAMAVVDLGAVAERVLAGLRAAVEESGATVEVDALPSVTGDEIQLEQVLANLIGNALKFRGVSAPRVVVTATRAHREWVIGVADNGIGIPADSFERIFVIFQRLHAPQEFGGTGLGLALCKRIVERHGGRIWVESSPGRGSTFRFTMPTRAESG